MSPDNSHRVVVFGLNDLLKMRVTAIANQKFPVSLSVRGEFVYVIGRVF